MFRFYAPDLNVDAPVVSLPEDEAHHLTRVLRLKPGADVTVFDGMGNEFHGRVEAAGKRGVLIELGERRQPVPEAPVRITLAQALLKGDKMDQVIRDAVMLGASAIQPLLTTRTEARPGRRPQATRQTRWQGIVVSSVKQCGRAVVPVVREAATVQELVAARAGLQIMLVEPSAATGDQGLDVLEHRPRPTEAVILVGPEGGWGHDELKAAAAHDVWRVTLGPRTLRADAAGAAALSILQYIWRARSG